MNRYLRYLILAIMALSLGLVLGSHRSRAQTVDEIVSCGTINIGVLIDLPPYGLLSDTHRKWFNMPLPELPVF